MMGVRSGGLGEEGQGLFFPILTYSVPYYATGCAIFLFLLAFFYAEEEFGLAPE
jgi:hypothetical protein